MNEILTPILGKAARLAGPIRARMAALEPQKISDVSRLALGDPRVIPLWYGESDLPTPEFIRRAAKDALDRGETFYTHKRGTPPLRQALASYMSGLYGKEIAVDRVTVATAGMNAILVLMELVLDAGDNVAMVTPAWPNAAATVAIMGAELREVALRRAQGRWRLDLDELFAAVDGRTRMIFINSPSNPTGWMVSREEQRAVLDFCRARNIWVLADEVYARIVYHGKAAPSFLEIAEPDDPLFVANSFSKAWAMTGWRIGWITAPAALGDIIGELVGYNTSGVPTFLQPAAVTALRDGEPFVAEMVERCRRGRDIVADHLATLPRVRFVPPEAAFYAFFEVEGMSDSLAMAKRLVQEAGVGIAPGAAFGKGGEGFLRLCFAQAPDLLERAMARVKRVLG
ncbi:MAG TPA: pyridoxal phosphate-dependent aminotransferase [Alphaproteobacteria bacterium]|nr:pyridoxal phosphate-dependent aminotransferase [Alphaproteobacteria bacterium]